MPNPILAGCDEAAARPENADRNLVRPDAFASIEAEDPPISARLRFFLAGVATTIAIITAGFGGGALFASSASKQVRPARIEHQAAAPPARAALPATSEPITAEPVVVVGLRQEKAQQTQLPPQAQLEAQTDRPKTKWELREERRKLREDRREARKATSSQGLAAAGSKRKWRNVAPVARRQWPQS